MNIRRRTLNWPAAATLISAMIGAAAASLALAIAPDDQPAVIATSREIGEVKARLTALEQSTQQLRTELRSDLRELREVVVKSVGNRK